MSVLPFEAYRLYWDEGFSPEQISEILDMDVGDLRKNLYGQKDPYEDIRTPTREFTHQEITDALMRKPKPTYENGLLLDLRRLLRE